MKRLGSFFDKSAARVIEFCVCCRL